MIVSSTPDVRVVELDPSDTAVVVASDGLWDVVQVEEAAHIVIKVITDLPSPASSSCMQLHHVRRYMIMKSFNCC